ncbi:MAG TPA: hypothetical protein VNO31_39715, partial [Umezawaea sp.]|nr:hypothetical protein [Umezawaea sp.]
MRRGTRNSALCALVLLTMAQGVRAEADPDAAPVLPPGAVQADSPAPPPPTERSVVEPGERDELLGQGWQGSDDRLWTTSGDGAGLHLLVAEARTGYSWRTAATLSLPGVEADQWIGNACVTGSGTKAVVVYAPRTYTNKEQLTDRGGFTAVVDLTSGAVTAVPLRTSLAYFNPGCGAGEVATLTQEGDADLGGKTGVFTLDTTSGKLSGRTEIAAQVTSATPVRDGFVVADAVGLLRYGPDGTGSRLVKGTGGVPSHVTADADGGVVFVDRVGDTARVRRVAPDAKNPADAAVTLATGRRGELSTTTGAAGRVFITGKADEVNELPRSVVKLDVPVDAEVSTTGDTAVTGVSPAGSTGQADQTAPRPVHIGSKSLKTGRELGFTVDPGATVTPRWDETVDAGRVCAVPRNDPKVQVYQPKPKQVEWAVDMAVKDGLEVYRPAGWHGTTGVYRVKDLFPAPVLTGGGQVPAQVMLGILGQESNLWQASKYALPGEYANPLIGNYYGIDIYNDDPNDDWTIRWDKADCGYGVSQMTDGMRLAGHPKPGKPDDALPTWKQEAIGTDYAANAAAGLKLLGDKWNQLKAAGVTLNDGNPAAIENWFYAAWAYNSGYHVPGEAGSAGAYGLGWLNNPINPRYSPDRPNFGVNPRDYSHPQDWPYPEKVLGFASNPPSGYEAPGAAVPFFRAAYWNGSDKEITVPGSAKYNRDKAFPDAVLFCTAANDCEPGAHHQPNAPDLGDQPAGPCAHKNAAGQYDLQCWVHHPAVWKTDCASTCGHEYIRYDYPEYAAEPENGTSFPPACSNTGLEEGAAVIDDVSGPTKPIRVPTCAIHGSTGSFAFEFGTNGSGQSGKIDLHQIGGGYGAHYWFTHSAIDNAQGQQVKVKGTWSFDPVVDGLARVLVHLPSHIGSEGSSGPGVATYTIDTAIGQKQVKLNQYGVYNQWVSLGEFPFFGKPKVSLTNLISGAEVPTDVVFDAVAVQPLAHEGAPPYSPRIRDVLEGEGCMMVKGNTAANGGEVEVRPCTVWGANNWTVTRVSTGVGVQRYQLRDRGTGKCLENDPVLAGSLARVADCDTAKLNQQWTGIEEKNSESA